MFTTRKSFYLTFRIDLTTHATVIPQAQISFYLSNVACLNESEYLNRITRLHNNEDKDSQL